MTSMCVHGGTEPKNMEETNLNFRKDLAEEDVVKFEKLMKEYGDKQYCVFSILSCQSEQRIAVMGTMNSLFLSIAIALVKDEDLYKVVRDAVTAVSNYKIQTKTPEKKLS